MQPLISAVTDTAINALLSLTPDGSKKAWFIIDYELPTLNQPLQDSQRAGRMEDL